jgi:hypothetical protein
MAKNQETTFFLFFFSLAERAGIFNESWVTASAGKNMSEGLFNRIFSPFAGSRSYDLELRCQRSKNLPHHV